MQLARGLIILLLLCGQGTLLYRSLSRDSVTYDETEYLYSGYRTWKKGDLSINPHPPLVKALAGLGVLTLNPPLFPDPSPGQVRTAWPQARKFLYRNHVDPQRILIAARLPMLLLWAMLGVVIYCWSAELYGRAAGFFCFGLYLLSPTVAAHGRIVSTDLGLAAFSALTLYLFFRSNRRPSAWLTIATGISLGLTLGTRHQALLIAGLMPLLTLWLNPPTTEQPTARRRALKRCACQLLIAVTVLFALYGFGRSILYYPQGFELLTQDFGSDNHQAYILNGEISVKGWFHYFPLLMALKIPPLHLLTMLAALISLCWLRPHREEWIALLPALAMLIIAIVSRVNYGLRHIMFILPLLWILAGRLIKLSDGRPLVTLALGLALLSGTMEMSRIHPHYLAYISPLAGGPSQGYRLLADGNLDAGQDLGHLADRLKEKQYGDVYLCYFGNADPHYYKIAFRYLPGYWNESLSVSESARTPFPRYIAIGTTYLQLFEEGAYHWLLQHEPIDQVGYTIMIYDRQKHPEWLGYLAGVYAEGGYLEQAIGHLRELRRIDPDLLSRVWPWQRHRFASRPKAWLDYGVALHHAQYDREATIIFEELGRNPASQNGKLALENLGILLARQAAAQRTQGRHREAARLYQRAYLKTGLPG